WRGEEHFAGPVASARAAADLAGPSWLHPGLRPVASARAEAGGGVLRGYRGHDPEAARGPAAPGAVLSVSVLAGGRAAAVNQDAGDDQRPASGGVLEESRRQRRGVRETPQVRGPVAGGG